MFKYNIFIKNENILWQNVVLIINIQLGNLFFLELQL